MLMRSELLVCPGEEPVHQVPLPLHSLMSRAVPGLYHFRVLDG